MPAKYLYIAIFTITIWIFSSFAFASPVNPYDMTDCYTPSPEAVAMSQRFSATGIISNKLIDGWEGVDTKVAIGSSGRFMSSAPSTLVDRKADPELCSVIKHAKASCHKFKTEQAKAQFLCKLSNELLTPNHGPLTPESRHSLNDWYDAFTNAHPMQVYRLGFFLSEQRGVCQQRAILLKVLCDETGLKASLVAGYLPSGGRHTWTIITINGVDSLFDPTYEIIGCTDSTTLSKYHSAESVFRSKCIVLQQILPLLFEAKEKRDYTQQKALYDELLDIDEQSFGNFSLECSADHNNLGRVFTALGDKFSAMQHLQLALNIQTALLAPNDPILQSTRKLLNEVSLHFSR